MTGLIWDTVAIIFAVRLLKRSKNRLKREEVKENE